MSIISTDLRDTRASAREISYSPVAPLTARNVQNAIEQLQTGSVTPPTITATSVTFAMSPYSVLSTDYILEVDTTGGVVVINPQAVASRKTPLEIKDGGNAFTNNIQINTAIEGQNPYLIDSNYGSVTILGQ